MNGWPHILHTALLGSERQPVTLPAEHEPMNSLLAQLTAASPEANLLAAAALYTQQRRAGFSPSQSPVQMSEPALPESRPRVSSQAAYDLGRLLDGHFRRLLPEWMAQVKVTGQRVPEEALPALFALGVQKPSLRQLIVDVAGQRGRWLAAFNPAWEFARTEPDPSQWETTTGATRLYLLQQIRSTAPAQALQLIETTWTTEKAEDRAAFVACLQTGLSLADESFLELCLDDRSKQVRETAADLLARLPGSQLLKRMVVRAEALVTLKGRLRPSLAVILPEKADDALLRDGLRPGRAPASLAMGARAWQLCQILAGIPPTYWSEKWKRRPEKLLALAAHSDLEALFLEGWRRATIRHPDQEWVTALIARGAVASELLAGLPASQREASVQALVEANAFQNGLELFNWLGACQHPWSTAYGRLVLEQVRLYMIAPPPVERPLLLLLPDFAYYFPPEMADAAAALWQPHPDAAALWQPAIDKFMDLLHFRRAMLAALS